MNPIQFSVFGLPRGQPRPRAFARKMGDKYVARVFESGTAEEWKGQIAVAAASHRPDVPLAGAVRVDAVFIFPRPNRHYVANNPARPLRADAPHWHISKPDRDNLDKALLDALTQVGGMWRDDCQVCCGEVTKRYGDKPGAIIAITPIDIGGKAAAA